MRNRLALLALTLVILGAGCPPGPIRHPKAGFNRWDAKARLDRALAALPKTAPPRKRAELHRDLGWLLLMHFGDANRGRRHFALAHRADRHAAMPWVKAGVALMSDLGLHAPSAAQFWRQTLEDITRLRKAPSEGLTSPPGLSLDQLEILAVDRLRQQLPHARYTVTETHLLRLRAKARGAARASLSMILLGNARRRHNLKRVRQRLQEAGCPLAFTHSRRYGRFGRTELTHPFRPNLAGPLAGQTVDSLSCGLAVRSPSGAPGVVYVKTVVQAPEAGPAVLHVVFARPFVLAVNGMKIFGPEDRLRPRPSLREIPVNLRQGKNVLRFKLPVFASPARLQVQVTHGPLPKPGSTKPTAAYRALADVLHMAAAMHGGLADAGRAAAARLIKHTPKFTWGLYWAARLERADDLVGRRVGRARARVLLRKALRRAPGATRIRLAMASALRRKGKTRKALDLLRKIPPKAAKVPNASRIIDLARIRLYRNLGWRALAFRRVQKLARAHRSWLPAWKVYYLLALGEQSAAATLEAVRRIRSLDATSMGWAQTLARSGRHKEAVDEAHRLFKLTGDSRLLRLLAVQLRLARLPAGAVWRMLVRRASWDTESRLALADHLVSLGRPADAIRLLALGRQAHPEDASLRRALRALGGADPLARYRVDGRAAIATYRKAKWGKGKAPVYVLDRSVMHVFPSGGRVSITHQIVHLRTREAIARYAEVKLPPGVRVLTLRTIKQDGTIREPEDVGEKNSVSLSDVAVGDFIEVEYRSAGRAQTFWRAGGFFGSSFSFRSMAAHFFRSELVVVTPRTLTLQHTAWGNPPKPVTRIRGTLRETRWTANRVERVVPEPLIPHLAGILPTVLVGARVRWQDYLRQRAELAYDNDVASHAVRALARKLCRDKPPEQGARAVYVWVQKHIEESGNYSRPASRTLAARSGSRLALLRTLLRQCGVRTLETRLLKPRHRELARGTIPPVRLHSQPALWLRLKKGEVYLLPQLQQAPFGYLPPLFRKASALSVNRPGAKATRTPDQPGADARRTTMTVILEPDGSAVILGHEKLHGLIGLKFRAALRRVPAKQLRQYLERAFFGRFFLGAVITRLTFKHAKKLDRPLEMIYRLKVPRLARSVKRPGGGKRLVLRSGFFPALVGRIYGRLARRRLPLRLGPMGPMSLRLTIQLPAGFQATSLPPPVSLQTPYGRFSLKATARKGAVELRRSLQLPFRIVGPKQYPTFTVFAAQVDRAERITVVLDKK